MEQFLCFFFVWFSCFVTAVYMHRWAVSTVITRQNKIPSTTGEPTLALIPMWDMCNHCHGTVWRYVLKSHFVFYLCIEWSQKGIQGKRPRLIVKWCNLGRKRGGFFVYRVADYRRTQFPGWGGPQKRPAAFRMGNLVWGSWFHVTLAAVGT